MKEFQGWFSFAFQKVDVYNFSKKMSITVALKYYLEKFALVSIKAIFQNKLPVELILEKSLFFANLSIQSLVF